jgi:beta-phosphoglucomutase family hydrolase
VPRLGLGRVNRVHSAAIFDLDGVLVDSEPNHFAAERDLLADYGVEFTEAVKRPYIGRSNRDVLVEFAARHGIPDTVDDLLTRKNLAYLELTRRHVDGYPGTREILLGLRADGLPTALASGSSPDVIAAVLAALDLRDAFDVVVSADQVERGKPAPDLFLEAARRLGVPAGGCVVFEDSTAGVLAALAAGMRCVAIPYRPEPPLPDPFHRAHLLVEGGMPALDPAAVLAWLRG